jgi:hypothetical protein
MKRIYTLALCLLCACAFGELAEVQEGSRKIAISRLKPLPTAEDANTGFLETMATDTITVTTAAAVQMPQLAPNTVQVLMIASGTDVYFGPSDVTAGFDDFIPDGFSRPWTCLATTTPNIWFITGSGTAQVKFRPIGSSDL